jgi:hypothetical protein
LSSPANKRELIRFLLDQGKHKEHFLTVESGTFYVTCDEKCFQLSKEGMFEVPELESTQEEAENKNDASRYSCNKSVDSQYSDSYS